MLFNNFEHSLYIKEMYEEIHDTDNEDHTYNILCEDLTRATHSLEGYPTELAVPFDLHHKLQDIAHLLRYDLHNVICLKYGGRQFGYYSDLGDKRVVLIEDAGVCGVSLLKGGFTTPLCDFGTGYYKNAFKEAQVCRRLQEVGVPTQKVLQVISRTNGGHTCLIWRPSPFRFGTIEYIYRHCPHIMRNVWDMTKTHAGDPEMLDKELWRLIDGGYHDLCDMWDSVGFVHGCLNTDNLCLLPCGIDYGHSYFIDEEEPDLKFDPHQIYTQSRQKETIENNLQALKDVLSHTMNIIL